MNYRSVDIYKNKRSGNYIISHFAPSGKYGVVGWGKLIRLSYKEMKAVGFDIIMQSLEEFTNRDKAEGSEIATWSPEERKTFHKNHILVGISQSSPQILSISSMHHKQGGFISGPEDQIELALPTTPEKFFDALLKSFERSD